MCNHREYPWLRLSTILILVSFLFPPSTALAQTKPVAAASTNATASHSWLDAQLSGGIIYFLYASPPVINRYQISSETWLPDLTLSATPTAFRVTVDAIYIGFGLHAHRIALDGSGEINLLDPDNSIIALHVAGSILIVNCSHDIYGELISFDLSTLAVVDQASYYPYAMVGSSLSPGLRKVFGRTWGISPYGIRLAGFSATGLFTGQTGGVTYAAASKTWVTPNEEEVIDDSGIVYSTDNLQFRGSLLGHVDDIAFYGSQPIVLRGGTLIGFTSNYLETGSTTLTTAPAIIFVAGETIYGIYDDLSGPQVIKTPVSALAPPQPGPAVVPFGLNFTPDKVVLGSDETVYLLSNTFHSIFRWSMSQLRYLDTIPLLGELYTFTYSTDKNWLYTMYPNGSIYKIDLNGDLRETPFANMSAPVCGLAAAGSFVLTCTKNGDTTQIVFSSNGEVLSIKNFYGKYSNEYTWDPVRHNMYMINENLYFKHLIWENIDANGIINDNGVSSFSIRYPIRLKPDASIVINGSGTIFDALTLVNIKQLPNEISDAGWKGDTLVTLRPISDGSELQQWTDSLSIAKSVVVHGAPISLFAVTEGWLVITNLAGRMRFTVCSADLTCVNPPLAGFSANPVQGSVPLEVHFTNLSNEGPYISSLWDFGDDETSSDPNPVHLYTKSGNFSVQLTVTGPGGSDALVQNGIIKVNPVAADFSVSSVRGQAPLTVKFANQTQGGYSSVLWDFGDGTTGTQDNPSHIYQNPGIYSVTLTVDGPYGPGTVVKNDMITATLLAYIYVPMVRNYRPPLLKPGHYVFNNLCAQYALNLYGSYIGQMEECVPSVDIDSEGFMVFNYFWTLTQSPDASGCVVKYSDEWNPNMYIKDSAGNRYSHIEVGGTTYVDCMASDTTYTGWFKFPPATTKNTVFTFFDDDAMIAVGPITLPIAP